MTSLVSIFKSELTDFLAAREKSVSPQTFSNDCRILGSFDRYLHEIHYSQRSITEAVVAGWTQLLHETYTTNSVAARLGYLRNFLRYLQYCGVSVYIPQNPKLTNEYIPYIFSDSEIERIFKAADNLTTYGKKGLILSHAELPMILRMLYGCGFRIGELLHVHVRDVNFQQKTVLLKDTKNKKQRIVPMSISLSEMLERYCYAMGIIHKPESYLFPGQKAGCSLSQTTVLYEFSQLLKSTGIYISPKPHTRGQCIHCFRHLFAVQAFAQAERLGRSPASSIPYLSVYLGHYDMDGTEKYLRFSSDIFPEYTDLFESYVGNVFPEASYEK